MGLFNWKRKKCSENCGKSESDREECKKVDRLIQKANLIDKKLDKLLQEGTCKINLDSFSLDKN